MISVLVFIVFIVTALVLSAYRKSDLSTIKNNTSYVTENTVSQNQWQITPRDKTVILAAGESHDILEYAFIWCLIHEDVEVALTRKTLFEAKHLIIDFGRSKYLGHCSCEFHLLNQTYLAFKDKPIIFCGISQDLQRIFDTLECAVIAPALFVLPTLQDALLYCEAG